tara:strand:+ start:94 stop:291 length:198 start_codon:yes stop_codon:yes gene_type:complete
MLRLIAQEYEHKKQQKSVSEILYTDHNTDYSTTLFFNIIRCLIDDLMELDKFPLCRIFFKSAKYL